MTLLLIDQLFNLCVIDYNFKREKKVTLNMCLKFSLLIFNIQTLESHF